MTLGRSSSVGLLIVTLETGPLTGLPRVTQRPSDAVGTRTCISHLLCSWLGPRSHCHRCQCHVAHGNLRVSSSGNLAIKDRFIRRWVHKEGFSGFKRYVTAAEDKELEAKIAVVEKYNIRIPELVERIGKCHIEDWDFAGRGGAPSFAAARRRVTWASAASCLRGYLA